MTAMDTGPRFGPNDPHPLRDASAETRIPMIGRSPAFEALARGISRVASNDAPVLIEGETGSGKELAARAIHYSGSRRDRPFVPLNCGAIPENLVEAELFGHTRGAFTDARNERMGVVAQANGGTLFLDEIDALSHKAQVALLRFLQDHRYRRVGNDRELHCDARVIAASNRPLEALVASGAFRCDLLYRINILAVRIPPLRERAGDAELLADHYLAQFAQRYGAPRKRLGAASRRWINTYRWPGNVRELENLIHRHVLMDEGLEMHLGGPEPLAASAPAEEVSTEDTLDFHDAKARAIAHFERAFIARLLAQTHGNVAAAARLAHKERRALGKLIKKHGIDTRGFRA